MTAVALPAVAARPAPLLPGYRFELTKLLSQWRVRLLLIACWIAPGGFVAIVGTQSSLPSDTIFGRWMHATGWSGALVILAFSCEWALPLLVSLVAGDVFAAEDRLGTWRHLMIAVRSPRRIFVAKALSSITVILMLMTGLLVSGVVGGLLSSGSRPLVGLDGTTFTASQAAGRFLLAWLLVLAPTLAFAGIGLLGSVALGRSPMGLALPAIVAVGLALVQMLPIPVVLRLALPSQGFSTWHGLFTSPPQVGPLLIGTIVALVWAAVATAGAYLIFMRRDFTDLANDGSGRRLIIGGVVPLAIVGLLSVVAIGFAGAGLESGIGKPKVEQSLAKSYAQLYVVQTQELHRPAVTAAEIGAKAHCDKGGSLVPDKGAGNDWRCTISWHLPDAKAVGQAIYQLDITPDGRYVADGDGPVEVNGFFQVRAPYGDAPNPLWQFDGTVNLLASSRKG